MSQEQAFLETIRERPGSYADRLVYADWLLEHGDPRGEFIHCQVRARRLPSDSPRRLEQEARAHQLLLTHEGDWLGPLLGVIGNWEWRAGLLDWVTVKADVFLAHAERWLPALPLMGVHLRKARAHIADLARCPQLAHLSGLYLGDNDLTDDDLDVLLRSPHLKRMRTLYLHSNQLSAQAARILAESAGLPRLRELCLGHNHLGDEAMAFLTAAPHLEQLRILHLPMTGLTEAGVRTLAGSPLLARLRMLWLGLNLLPPGCLATLARSPAFTGLRSLGYEMNSPDDADVIALAGSPHAAPLQNLTLDGFPTVSDAGLSALAASTTLGQLRTLSLGSGPWGPAGIEALGRSRSLKSLRSLKITASNERGSDLAQALLGQPLVRRLRQLHLNVYRIGEAGLAALATHTRPLRLRALHLPQAPNQAAILESLLERSLLPALTQIKLSDPPPGLLRAVGEPGRLPQLRQLTLRGVPDLDTFQALLDSPLWGQLHELKIYLPYETEQQQGPQVLHRLCAAWNRPALRRLVLGWGLAPEQMGTLTEAPPPPALTELEIQVRRVGAKGMAALAGSPLLHSLRRLVFHCSSVQDVPGLRALADSPQVGSLLRVDIVNGHVPREDAPALRGRFGMRFAVGARVWPRTISMGGWNQMFGDGED